MYNLTLSLGADEKVALYEQIYRMFVREIQNGRLRPGERVPSKRALCGHLGVSRSTVETAYQILVAEGYLNARERSGYYVSDFVAVGSAGPEAFAVSIEGCAETPVTEPKAGPDFSTASVDVSMFPYSSWAKLYKEVVSDSPALLQLGERQGDLGLRKALTVFLKEYRGVKCIPEQIVVGAGMEYLTGLLLRLFPRDTVFGVEDPGYAGFAQTLQAMGRKARFLRQDSEGLCVGELEQSDASVAYITPSHQFPLGLTMPASRRSRLLRWAAGQTGRYLIEDDYDSEFRYTSRTIPALQGMDATGCVIYLGTFSRSLAPAIRAAYMVLPPPLLERYRELPGYRRSTVSRYEQAVLTRFLAEGYYSRYLHRVGNLYRGRRAALVAALEEIPEVTITGSGGGLHFLLTHSRLSEEELLARAGAEGIILRGLSAYCRECVPQPSTLVVGYGGLRDGEIGTAVQSLLCAWK